MPDYYEHIIQMECIFYLCIARIDFRYQNQQQYQRFHRQKHTMEAQALMMAHILQSYRQKVIGNM